MCRKGKRLYTTWIRGKVLWELSRAGVGRSHRYRREKVQIHETGSYGLHARLRAWIWVSVTDTATERLNIQPENGLFVLCWRKGRDSLAIKGSIHAFISKHWAERLRTTSRQEPIRDKLQSTGFMKRWYDISACSLLEILLEITCLYYEGGAILHGYGVHKLCVMWYTAHWMNFVEKSRCIPCYAFYSLQYMHCKFCKFAHW